MLTNSAQLPAPNGGKLLVSVAGGFTLLDAAANTKGVWLHSCVVAANSGVGAVVWLMIHTVQTTNPDGWGLLCLCSGNENRTQQRDEPIFIPPGKGIYGYAQSNGYASATWTLLT